MMIARDAIIEAFAQLPTMHGVDDYKSIGEVADIAARLMSGKSGGRAYKRNLLIVQRAFREEALPFSYSTHLARGWWLYRCGKRQWPDGSGYLKDGLTIGGKNRKVLRWGNALRVRIDGDATVQ